MRLARAPRACAHGRGACVVNNNTLHPPTHARECVSRLLPFAYTRSLFRSLSFAHLLAQKPTPKRVTHLTFCSTCADPRYRSDRNEGAIHTLRTREYARVLSVSTPYFSLIGRRVTEQKRKAMNKCIGTHTTTLSVFFLSGGNFPSCSALRLLPLLFLRAPSLSRKTKAFVAHPERKRERHGP